MMTKSYCAGIAVLSLGGACFCDAAFSPPGWEIAGLTSDLLAMTYLRSIGEEWVRKEPAARFSQAPFPPT